MNRAEGMSCHRAAAAYAERLSWAVFPRSGKVPAIKGGRGCLATINLQTIAAWWRDYPAANVGIATGKASGFDVVDVDGRRRLACRTRP